ncbi:MAG: hypothetical protein KGQ35_03590 [Burkholderiales bacterium]|nr:hypothetical protein [Burkholderiales bacterium]
MSLCKSAALAALGLVLAGCAAFSSVQPGMTRAEVVSQMGRPTAVVPLQGGEQRLQYSSEPAGQTVYMVDLDASGHVLRKEQVLTAASLARIKPGWSSADVLRDFGPPARIDHVANWQGDVWTYRWRSDADMYYWVYFDRHGKVGRTGQGMEFFGGPDNINVNGRK